MVEESVLLYSCYEHYYKYIFLNRRENSNTLEPNYYY